MNIPEKQSAEPLLTDSDLPEGWTLTTLGAVVKPSSARIEPQDCPQAAYLSLEHIEAQTTAIVGRGVGADVASLKSVFHAGDVLYGKLRPYLNKVCRPAFDGICSTDILVFPAAPAIDNRFLLHYLNRSDVVEYANHHSNGINLPRISFERLAEMELSLPPLAEQRRIAAKVETLLTVASATRVRLARVPLLLKRFRQAVLAAACSGRLTADWRDQNPNAEPAAQLLERILAERRAKWEAEGRKGKYQEPAAPETSELPELPQEWCWTSFGLLISELRNGIGIKPSMEPPGTPMLRINSVRSGKVLLDEFRFLPNAESLFATYSLRDDDLLFTRYNGSLDLLGVCGMVRNLNQRRLLYPDKLMRVRFDHDHISPPFAEILFQSPLLRECITAKSKSSAGQQGVTGEDIKSLPFALAPVKEQKEIVQRVEKLFGFADAIEKRTDAAAARADRLTQSILAKAFRGELVPTEAELARAEGREYEPSSALLERIRAGREAGEARRKPGQAAGTKKKNEKSFQPKLEGW